MTLALPFHRFRLAPGWIAAAALACLGGCLLLDPRHGDSVWVYHPKAALAQDNSLGDMYRRMDVEYPPGAVYVIVGTEWLSRRLTDTPGPRTYRLLFRLEMLLAAAMIFAILRRLLPTGSSESIGRLLLFPAGLLFARHVAFDRPDLLVGLLMLASLELLNAGRRKSAVGLLAAGAV
ncbi:MAG: hypothetical protein ACJ8F7_12400 [Gemmataceae bacterium]